MSPWGGFTLPRPCCGGHSSITILVTPQGSEPQEPQQGSHVSLDTQCSPTKASSEYWP